MKKIMFCFKRIVFAPINGIWYVVIINDVRRRMSCVVIAIIYLFKLLLLF